MIEASLVSRLPISICRLAGGLCLQFLRMHEARYGPCVEGTTLMREVLGIPCSQALNLFLMRQGRQVTPEATPPT
jgi:hypothetical protein